jgi:hypothetical protein
MHFDGSRGVARPAGEGLLPGVSNFYIGSDPAGWREGVQSFASVVWRGLYDGVDLRLREGDRGAHYDLVLAPGADLSSFRGRVEGADALEIGSNGELIATTASGVLRQTAPPAWEEGPGQERRELTSRFVLLGAREFGFEVEEWDRERALVVDPGLVWSSYYGGSSADRVTGVGSDLLGRVTIAGRTLSPDLPVSPGWYGYAGYGSCFVARIDPSSGGLDYATYFGGGIVNTDDLADLAVEPSGGAVVCGRTDGVNFPITPGAFDPTKSALDFEGFVARFAADGGSLVYCTYLGGNGADGLEAVTVDSSGATTVAGYSSSPDFPVTPNAYDTTQSLLSDAVLAKLRPDGSGLLFSTYLGGNHVEVIFGIDTAPNGDVVVGGYTASSDFPTTPGAYDTQQAGPYDTGFIARLDSTASTLLSSTLLEGSSADHVYAVGVDASDRIYVTGFAGSADFPVTPGAYKTTFQGGEIFVSCLSPDLGRMLHATFLGSAVASVYETVFDLTVDPSGVVTIVGDAPHGDFPTTLGSLFPTKVTGSVDGFVTRLRPDLSGLLYSTFLHGISADIFDTAQAVSALPDGGVLVGGFTVSQDFPTTAGAYQSGPSGDWDGFACQLDMLPTGTARFGSSTASCLGPIALIPNKMPVAGDASFGLVTSAAPPNAVGVLGIGAASLASGIPLLGVTLFLDLGQPLVLLGASADAHGWSEKLLPLPAASAGATVHCQIVWIDLGSCGSPGAFSATNGLSISPQ